MKEQLLIPSTMPLPLLVGLHKEYEHGSVTLYVDARSKFGGALSARNILREACPPLVRDEFSNWILIQKERKRIGLPYLESEEMIIQF